MVCLSTLVGLFNVKVSLLFISNYMVSSNNSYSIKMIIYKQLLFQESILNAQSYGVSSISI